MEYRDSPDRPPVIRPPPMIDRATGQPVRPPTSPIQRAWPRNPRYPSSPGYGRYSPDYPDEGPRRFLGDSPPYGTLPPPPPPPGFWDESPRRNSVGSPSDLYPDGLPPPGYRDTYPDGPPPPDFRGDDSPRYRYHSPPSPGYADEGPRRFAGSPLMRQAPRDGALRRFETESPPHRYMDESPRRFADGLSPHHYLEGPEGYGNSPHRHLDGTPHRSPQRYLEAPPPHDSPPGYIDDGIRRFAGGSTPPRLPADDVVARRDTGGRTPPRFTDSPPVRRLPAGSTPPPPFIESTRGYADDIQPRKFSRGNNPAASPPPPGYPEGSPNRYTPPRASPLPPAGYPNVSPRRTPPRTYDGPVQRYDAAPNPPQRNRFENSPTRQSAAQVAFTANSFPPVYAGENLPPRNPDGTTPNVRLGGRPIEASPPRHLRRPSASTPAPGRDNLDQPAAAPPSAGVPNFAHAFRKEDLNFRIPLPRRYADGYKVTTPPRDFTIPPRVNPDDTIYTANVVPIFIEDRLKDQTPRQGNPGRAPGGGWKDMWAAVVFVLHLGGLAAVSLVYGLKAITSTIENFNNPNAFRIIDWFPQLCAAGITGAVFSCIWQMLFRIAPVGMILFTIWAGAFAMSILGIVLIATGETTGLVGLAFFFAGLSQCLYAFVVRNRIPFAGELLRKVISILNRYPSTYIVSYFGVLVGCCWTTLWIFGVSGIAKRPYHSFIIVGYVASFVWTMQVLRNLIRVAVAGTVSQYYYNPVTMEPMPTMVALLKACTLSLGTICFGSLTVPLIEVPCHVLRRINAQGGQSEFLFSCVTCFLHCFEGLIRYFNKWAYIQVAIYSKPFVRASKDTWDMLRGQDVDCLIHDDLIGSIMLISCSVGGSLSALVGGIWTFVAHKSLTIGIAIVSFFIGFSFTYLTLAVYESGVATYYVLFAEDPDSLQRHDGPLYEKMWVRQMYLNPEAYSNPNPEVLT